MKKLFSKRILAVFLSVLMLIQTFMPDSVYADELFNLDDSDIVTESNEECADDEDDNAAVATGSELLKRSGFSNELSGASAGYKITQLDKMGSGKVNEGYLDELKNTATKEEEVYKKSNYAYALSINVDGSTYQAMCLSYGKKAGKTGASFNSISTPTEAQGRELYLKGAVYGYEFTIGNKNIGGITGLAPGYGDKISATEARIAFQIATWRISAGKWDGAASENSDAGTVTNIACNICGVSSANDQVNRIVAAYKWMKINGIYANSGNYPGKYNRKVSLFFYRPTDATWQDLMHWGVDKPEEKTADIKKLGEVTKIAVNTGAQYTVYYDKGCNNAIQSATTNSEGKLYFNLPQGVYYFKETVAPEGYEKDDNVYKLDVTENYAETTVTDEEETFKLKLNKYDKSTRKLLAGAVFGVYEPVGGKWVKVGELKDCKNGTYTTDGMTYKCHNLDGSLGNAVKGYLPYTGANKGKYKIIEESAPDGFEATYTKTIAYSDIKSKLKGGYLSLTTFDTGVQETPLSCKVKVGKYDSITKGKLEGAVIDVYEYNTGKKSYLHIGTLVASGKTYTSAGKTFVIHDEKGDDSNTRSKGELVYSTANKGNFMLKETSAPKNYTVDSDNKIYFNVSDAKDSSGYIDLTSYSKSFKNTKTATVKLYKKDSMTKESLSDAVFEISEWSKSKNKYLKIGTLKYVNSDGGYYALNGVTHYKEGGKEVNSVTQMLHYTSENLGKFKVEETVTPEGHVGTYSKFFSINSLEDGGCYELSSKKEPVLNTPIKANVTVAKYDTVTKKKIKGAEFTLYEYNGSQNKWIKLQTLSDNGNGTYSSTGLVKQYDSDGKTALLTSDTEGYFYYTRVNRGKFKIVETKAPYGYKLDGYTKEFTINVKGSKTQKFDFTDYKNGAKDTPKTVGLTVVKKDSDNEKLLTGAEFVLKEYSIKNNNYRKIGVLKDLGNGSYDLSGQTFTQRDGIKRTGEIKKTTDNGGKFCIEEVKAPAGYKIPKNNISYIDISNDTGAANKVQHESLTIYNSTVKGTFSINKVDVRDVNKKLKGAKFDIYEYSAASGTYAKCEDIVIVYDESKELYYPQYTLSSEYSDKTGDGIAYLHATADNAGKFYVVESENPENYMSDKDLNGEDLKYYIQLTGEEGIKTGYCKEDDIFYIKDSETGKLSHSETGIFSDSITNRPLSIQITLIKKDSSGTIKANGNATLKGAEYVLVPAEDIYVNGELKYQTVEGKTGYKKLSELVKEMKNYEAVINADSSSAPEKSVATAKLNELKEIVKGRSVMTSVTGGTDDKPLEDGRAIFTDVYPGKYLICEVTAPNGYLIDEKVKEVTVGEDNKVSGYNYTVNATEVVKKKAVKFTKTDTDGNKLAGASFDVYNVKDMDIFKDYTYAQIAVMSEDTIKTLITDRYKAGDGKNQYDFSTVPKATLYTVNSDKDVVAGKLEKTAVPNQYYVKTIVSGTDGVVSTPELPYGTYAIYETKTPQDKYSRIELIVVRISEDGVAVKNVGDHKEIDTTKRQSIDLGSKVDPELFVKLKIVKKDSETEYPVLGRKAQYRLSRKTLVGGQEVLQPVELSYVTDAGEAVTTSVFDTDEEGVLRFNDNFQTGDYVLEEVTAPDGYLLSGVKGYFNPATGKIESTPQEVIQFTIGSDSILSYDEVSNTYYYEVSQYDYSAKGMLLVYKTGEQLTGAEKKDVKFNKIDYRGLVSDIEAEKNVFKFDEKPLKDVVFEVSAAENIMAADGRNTVAQYVNPEGDTIDLVENAVIAKISTDESGYARLENLPCGKYNVKEISTVDGFIKDETVKQITVENSYDGEGKLLPVTVSSVSIKNERQHYSCSLKKVSAEATVVAGAVYGLYTAEAIKDATGNVIAEEGTLIDINVSNENGDIEFTEDLPFAAYYIQEIQAPEGFKVNTECYDVIFNQNSTDEVIQYFRQVEDDRREGKVRVLKIDSENGEGIEGVQFTISLNGTVIETIETDSDGKAESQYLKMYDDNMVPYEYTLTETKYPEGFVKGDYSEKFTITDADEEDTDEEGRVFRYAGLTVKNDRIKVSVSKKSVTDSIDLIGAVLTVTDSNGEIIDSWETDGTEHIIDRLEPGVYTLTEEYAPYGYKVADSVQFTVSNTNEIQKVVMYDNPVHGKLNLKKIDTASEKPLPNAEFELRDVNDNVLETLVTDANGEAESAEYPVGVYKADGSFEKLITYKLVEVKAPEGYSVGAETFNFEFEYTEGQESVVKDLTIGNKLIAVKISKKSFTTGQEIKGAKLSVYDSNNKLVTSWISNGQEHEITKLVPGSYTLVEESAPFGYTVSESVKFKVYGHGEIQKIVMYDKPIYGNIEIVKTDADTSKPLQDAVFQIQDENGKVLETLVTNEKGKAVSAKYPVGTYGSDGTFQNLIKYRLVEVKAPKGYNIDKTVRNIVFEKTDNGTGKVTKYVDVTNKKNTVKISKKSVTTGKDIKGAALSIYNSNGRKVAQWVSNGKPHVIRGLAAGTYKLVEERAPFGYTVAESVEFEVKDNTIVKKVVMHDSEVYGRLKIKKIDDSTGNPLAGVEFKIKNSAGKVLQTLVTDENGRAESKKLPMATYNADGTYSSMITYTVEETKALNGYAVMSDDIDFQFEYKQGDKYATKTLNISNKPGTVEISKKSITTGKDIKGATLTVYDSKNTFVDSWVSDGTAHKISGLKAGRYTLVEERAPFGYKIAESVEFKVGRNYEIKKVTMYDSEIYGRIVVTKKETGTDKLLEGARFELRDEKGNLLEVLVTGKDGKAESGLYPAATYNADGTYANVCLYTLVETEAPSGHVLNNMSQSVKFDLTENTNKDVESNITIYNKPVTPPVVPPKTGDYVKFGLIVLFIGSASAFMILGCKKNKKSEDEQ